VTRGWGKCFECPAWGLLILSVLLTISTTHRPATDLGFLLHKNPGRHHLAEFGFGTAHVFYPEASDDRCSAAVLVDVDPVGLVRGPGSGRERPRPGGSRWGTT